MTRVRITVSDPPEFVGSSGSNVLEARIARTSASGFPLVLELTEAIRARAAFETRYFITTADGDSPSAFQDLLDGRTVPCRLTGISLDQAGEHDPFTVAGWRGGYPTARAEVAGLPSVT